MKDLTVSKEIRPLLKKPFGKVYKGKDLKPAEEIKADLKGEKVIVVGDVTLKNILAVGIRPSLAIIDLKTKRNIKEDSAFKEKTVKAKNPPGMITKELWDEIAKYSMTGDWPYTNIYIWAGEDKKHLAYCEPIAPFLGL